MQTTSFAPTCTAVANLPEIKATRSKRLGNHEGHSRRPGDADTRWASKTGTVPTARTDLLQRLPKLPIATHEADDGANYWVKGWYYDALYPGDYFYVLFKEDTAWADVTGATRGVPDGIVNIFDEWYIIDHWNAKAPIPGIAVDPKWIGTYGCGSPDVHGDRVVNMQDITEMVETLPSRISSGTTAWGNRRSCSGEFQTPGRNQLHDHCLCKSSKRRRPHRLRNMPVL